MKSIETIEQFEQVLKQPGIHVFLFTANWCPDCVYIKPFMPSLEQKYEKDMDFYSVDRDQLLDLAIEQGIMGIPSFIAYKDGKRIASFISSLRKSEQEIDAFLQDTRNKGEKEC